MILQHDYRDEILFEKLRYCTQCYMTNAKSRHFKFLRFEDVKTNLNRSQGSSLKATVQLEYEEQ